MAGRKQAAAERLAAVRAETDHELLIKALEDPAAFVVEAAARRITAPKAAGALLRAYLRLHRGAPGADPGCWARMALVEALGRLEAPEGEEAARLAVRTVQVEAVGFGMADTATGLRVAGASLLANIRPPGALLDLAWLLHDFEPNAPCSHQERPYAKLAARTAAAKAIGALGDPAGAAVLHVKLAFPGEELPEVLAECMDGLAALKEPRTLELLTPFLGGPSAYLAAAAGTAIAAAGGAKAVGILVEALERAPRDAREPLVYALASIRADEARSALERLSRHADPVIRKTAGDLL
ncbi:MAG TPA: hypothetical protein VD969_20555 [Symbiobacteriaceae bacterium]|nr:hypothetical protein [Symbiobacteriaceae bacterium]